MLRLHSEILSKDGNKEFAVIPYEEFEAVQQMPADLADFAEAKKAEGHEPSIPWEEDKRRLDL